MKKFSLKAKKNRNGDKAKIAKPSVKTYGSNIVKSNAKAATNPVTDRGNDKPEIQQQDQDQDHDHNGKENGDIPITNIDDLSGAKEASPIVIKPSPLSTSKQAILSKQRFLKLSQQEPLDVQSDMTKTADTGSTALNTVIAGLNPTTDSYKKVPVSEFGLAMLRGMASNTSSTLSSSLSSSKE